MRACRFGLRTISGSYYKKVFGPPGVGMTDVLFDCQDFHTMFRLIELDIEMVRPWYM